MCPFINEFPTYFYILDNSFSFYGEAPNNALISELWWLFITGSLFNIKRLNVAHVGCLITFSPLMGSFFCGGGVVMLVCFPLNQNWAGVQVKWINFVGWNKPRLPTRACSTYFWRVYNIYHACDQKGKYLSCIFKKHLEEINSMLANQREKNEGK